MVAGDKRRSAENLELKSLPYFINICLSAGNTRDACLVALLYLSGRRIGEILKLRKRDIKILNGYFSFETLNEKCFRHKPQGTYTLKTDEEPDRYYEKINVSFSTETETYRKLGPFIQEHLKTLSDESYIFGRFRGKTDHLGPSMAYLTVRRLDPDIWLHWIRHQRFSQVAETLKTENVMDALPALKQFTKHHRTDSDMAYIHRASTREIMKKI